MSIHWAGGRTSPPPDVPDCGFDNSLCKTMPGYAILSIVLSSVVVILAIASALIYRHYKLEAEIASMTWKVNYNDIIRVPQEKWRTSMASLIRRNSQRVNDTIITFCYALQQKKIIYRVKFILNVRLCFHRLI
ncbi:receptor-type guanylate cyclase gcy-28-like [Acyrthosiphon pisum]|uniref:Uncharacterized protein n=1 Tax=Acyrthosiphon pisum TaxID=7029 RepID=A0A8R2F7Q6_ACYPI|nr:receptor-type guanylate cyclase gcy-28-like [Acyrthosiphon pisum]|eukprot:XP_008182497.1 PREDICTED: receptor-type guanylate cyclase gcy-28-like [Acyrthosiphon pisum]